MRAQLHMEKDLLSSELGSPYLLTWYLAGFLLNHPLGIFAWRSQGTTSKLRVISGLQVVKVIFTEGFWVHTVDDALG